MMRSAADFLPLFMTTFMNLASISLLNFGSGRMVRTGAWARRDMTGLPLYFLGRLAPYLERPCLRSVTPAQSRVPRTVWYRTPGRSFTRPPRISTTECSWRLWPSPPMYEMTSKPFVRRTLATLRSAEFGFFGVVVYTRVHTPRRWGQSCKAGLLLFVVSDVRPLRTS